jgi:hypothetical protein
LKGKGRSKMKIKYAVSDIPEYRGWGEWFKIPFTARWQCYDLPFAPTNVFRDFFVLGRSYDNPI